MMTGNEVTVIGTLVENKLGKGKTKDGRDYVNGYLVTTDGTSRIRTDYIAMQQVKSGENPAFRDIVKIMNEAVETDEANNITGTLLKIGGGRLENSDYFGQDGNLISNPKVTASFPRMVKQLGEKEQMGGVFSFTGCIENIIEEIKNDQLTGRLNITITGINYDECANTIHIIVPAEFATAFQGMYTIGQTTTINGRIINIFESKTIETQVAWGNAEVKTQTTLTREFLATGGSHPFAEDDINAVTPEILANGKAKKEQKLQQEKANAEARAAAKQQQNMASSGFSGNANAFANATAGGNTRPTF